MKINFYLPNPPAKDGECGIYCYVREYDETFVLNTGQRVKPEFWDKTKQTANPRKTRNKILKGELNNLNEYLIAFSSKIKKNERNIRDKKPDASFNIIADAIKRQFDKKKDGFFDIYDDFLTVKRNTVSKDALQKYKRVKSLLEEYEKSENIKLSLDNLDALFFDKFYPFLTSNKNMLNNTAHKTIQFLKTFLIWANERGLTDNTSYKSFKAKSEQNEVIYLTNDELMNLYKLEIEDKKLDRVRDLFLFQCFTGVRYSDIENLSKEDIQGSIWKLRTQKTRDIIEIPLNSYAQSILAKYTDWEKPLPIISNQKVNKYIKEVCELCKIDSLVKIIKYQGNDRIEKTYKKFDIISSHSARRTFISLSLEKGMKPDVIMSITGHKTYRMMQRYLKIADKHKREEMDKAWGSSLRAIKKN